MLLDGITLAARAYVEARRAADEEQRTLDEAKAQLIALTSHTSETGCGVSVTRYWRRGSFAYSKIEDRRAKSDGLGAVSRRSADGDADNLWVAEAGGA